MAELPANAVHPATGAQCWGRSDSKTAALDDERSMRWMAPRRAKTGWSASNKARVEKLIAAGLMAEPGLAKVRAAKKQETRDKRVAEIARLAAMNIRANQWIRKPRDATSD